ncbi:aromatic-ring hydroxylase C-terminal domain-containing protein, partial [Amycolatopsis pithecellobii]|uniref:aromatic-ring hydroxylase C-terminal domain-containing protein n=1 Tax=Amycolatopsis pithecellobii TaxID=664692 RepID=UPI00406BAF8B
PGLLASYEAERRGVAEQTLASAVRNLQATGPALAPIAEAIQASKTEEFHSLGLVLGYSYAGSPVVANGEEPPALDVSSYVPSTHPGSRLPHAWTAPGRTLYDDLGRGLTVLHPRAADPDAVAGFAVAQGIPLTILPAPAGWPQEWAGDFLVVRPDQHIAWRGPDLTTVDLPLLCGGAPSKGAS